jgi:hypothetical protein
VSEYHLEVTRDLNGPADEFCHEDSCWWGGESESRCALKSWGGLALRSYGHESDRYATGRAWVQPLDETLRPTHDAVGAKAYIVYNGYEKLDGYTPARIVAHLTGLTYRKIELHISPQYVNGSSGYLVADEATCAETNILELCYDQHYKADSDTIPHPTDSEVIAA